MPASTSPLDEEHLALAALTWLIDDAQPRYLRPLTHAHGAAKTLSMITAGESPSGLPPEARAALELARRRIREVPDYDELAAIFRSGIRLVCPGDDEWPSRLDDLGDDTPLALWARGTARLTKAAARSVSIIGSRAATAYGTRVASDIASAVAGQGWTVVSGAAYGIDGAAHRGALAAGGTTVAVLACGVDRAYPVGHADLIEATGRAGVIVSEQPPHRVVSRARLLGRNRITAALSAGTVVVEAGLRSGSMHAARGATELGRLLMAVPGPVTSATSSGCHLLIRQGGAVLVTCGADVIETLVGSMPENSASATFAD
jgi:DNA processing protein